MANDFGELKQKMAHVWGSAPWERAEHTLAPVHEHLVRILDPRPGLRFLDVATGTGAVARLAARAGADVTGIDLAPALVETARGMARAEGLDVRFLVGDAEQLPVADEEFDAVASSMGAIFAPVHARVAAELARVTRSGGRLAISAWTHSFVEPVCGKAPLEPGQDDPMDWGEPGHAQRLLGDAFELSFEEGDAPLEARSGEDAWELLSASVGPFSTRVRSLSADEREELRERFVAYMESFRDGDRIVASHRYRVIVGRRR